ncbi:helix-turn-helix domain-containing protein [Anaerotignum sp. MB30-C6]|uniref:helix-turn-helix domain-containing protein n=1 Tax=Anaerotignum sp. MB30-C6 TaxID=3070814 RepID=UPI0027DC58EC|nr:helix-turn-helix domain-containing protein [Anaerotignum sp. MB30-C6]WMI82022.1 helix-turn-helix domain-containing protein [Anaerotignum sp. MB30-C6]
MKTIADRIKEGLAMKEMKQSDLVELTGIGKSSISSYISGQYEPKQRNIYKIAKALGVNEAWLMGYDTSKERSTDQMQKDLDMEYMNSLSELNYSKELVKIHEFFSLLNEEGRKESIKRIEELTYLKKYTK